MSPSETQPHGLCLLVSGGVLDSVSALQSVYKSTVAKMCTCIGQLCSSGSSGILGDAGESHVLSKRTISHP